jgi:hypothetical protein
MPQIHVLNSVIREHIRVREHILNQRKANVREHILNQRKANDADSCAEHTHTHTHIHGGGAERGKPIFIIIIEPFSAKDLFKLRDKTETKIKLNLVHLPERG